MHCKLRMKRSVGTTFTFVCHDSFCVRAMTHQVKSLRYAHVQMAALRVMTHTQKESWHCATSHGAHTKGVMAREHYPVHSAAIA